MNIIDVKWEPARDGVTILHWGPGDGSLQVLVDELPKHVYRKIGRHYYSEQDGFVSVFLHDPTNNRGFAGREFSLDMEDGSVRTFKGTLWDPMESSDDLPEFCSISITADPEVMERGYTFYSGKVTLDLYLELRNRALGAT